MPVIPGGGFILAVVAILFILLLAMRMAAALNRKEPPNTALIIYGGKGRRVEGGATVSSRVLVGGGALVWPWIQATKTLSLQQIAVDVLDQQVPAKNNVRVNVDAVAFVKVGETTEMINTAAQQFLDNFDAIKTNSQHVLQTHLRSIVATMDVTELIHDHEGFQTNVANRSKPELESMGLRLISFNVRNITDDNGYIEAMGKPAIAQTLRDASIAEAEAQQSSRTKVAEANRLARESELQAEVAIADAQKQKDVQVAGFKRDADTALAEADNALALKQADIDKDLATRNGAAAIEQARQAALAAEQAITVAKNKQQAEVVIPANAEKEAAIAKAEGNKQATILQATADAEKTTLTGKAEAEKTKAVGLADADVVQATKTAEAEGEQRLAAARSANDAVNLQQYFIEQFFGYRTKAAEYNAEAIGRFGSKVSITQIGGSSGDGHMLGGPQEVARFLASLNAESEAMTGMNLRELMVQFADFLKSFRTQAEVKPAPEGTPPANEQSATN
ncbi:MAG: flotillin family protein [Chloroflexota bacterium]